MMSDDRFVEAWEYLTGLRRQPNPFKAHLMFKRGRWYYIRQPWMTIQCSSIPWLIDYLRKEDA